MDDTYADARRAWGEHLQTHNVALTGGAHRLTCPLCTDEHLVCRFTAGALHCVNDGCGNPHHRPAVEIIPF